MKKMNLSLKIGEGKKRPQNLLLVIIKTILFIIILTVLFISFFVFIIFFKLFVIALLYPFMYSFFFVKPDKEFLQNHEYKIVKFIRQEDVWGERDYTWYLKFPKGFNSADAIPLESDIECIEYDADKGGSHKFSAFEGFVPQNKKYILYPDRVECPTRTLTYIPGKEPEDLLLEYNSR